MGTNDKPAHLSVFRHCSPVGARLLRRIGASALILNLLGLISDDQLGFGTNVLSVDALGQKSA
jgi:hypothetical protein